jgi:lipoprotein NlpI
MVVAVDLFEDFPRDAEEATDFVLRHAKLRLPRDGGMAQRMRGDLTAKPSRPLFAPDSGGKADVARGPRSAIFDRLRCNNPPRLLPPVAITGGLTRMESSAFQGEHPILALSPEPGNTKFSSLAMGSVLPRTPLDDARLPDKILRHGCSWQGSMSISSHFTGVVFLATAVALTPTVTSAQSQQWQLCTHMGNPDQRIAACTDLISRSGTNPDRSRAYCARGAAYQDNGDLDRAIKDYNESVRLDPGSASYICRANGYRARHENDLAMADYSQALKLEPNNAPAHVGRGNIYSDQGDYDRTIAEDNEAIRINPKYELAYYNRGNAYIAKGDNDRAIADYTEAIRLYPNYVSAYNNRGQAHHAKGDHDRAIADYTEAIRLNPKRATYYKNRGLAYFYAGNPAKSLADVGQASELDPKDAYIALWVDIVGQRNNVSSHLAQAIAKIDMTAWPSPVIRMFLGQMTPAAVLAAADDSDAKKKKGQICEANFYSGELALKQGAKDEAVRLFRLATSDCPKNSDEWAAANAELKAFGAVP